MADTIVDDRPPRCSTGSGRSRTLFTLVRLLCLPIFLYLLFGRDNQAAAAWMLGALGATDWVDGYLARRLDQVSEFGKVFDPTVDRLLFIVAITAIIIDGSMPIWFAVAVLAREILVGLMMVDRHARLQDRPHRRHVARQAGHVPADVRRAGVPDGQQRLPRRRRLRGRRLDPRHSRTDL